MGTSIISYDSPWEEIREAARAAPWSATPQRRASGLRRPPLTEDEISSLSGIPVLVVQENQLPPHPKYYPQIAPHSAQYHELMGQRVQALGQRINNSKAFYRFGTLDELIEIANTTSAYSFIDYALVGAADSPAIRHGPMAQQLNAPLPHRLHGDIVPTSAILVTDSACDTAPSIIACASRSLWLPPEDHKVMCDLHEMLHLTQLGYLEDTAPVLNRALAERDAENGALIFYQSAFGGPAHYAAAAIMAHISYQFEFSAGYGFRPGLPLPTLDHGSRDAFALRAHCLYTQLGQTPPRFPVLAAWGQLQHDALPENEQEQFGPALDEISLFMRSYLSFRGVKGMLEDTLHGLKMLTDRAFEDIPPHIHPLAQQLADAAAFTNPEIMGSDPVKPRVSCYLPAKTNTPALS